MFRYRTNLRREEHVIDGRDNRCTHDLKEASLCFLNRFA